MTPSEIALGLDSRLLLGFGLADLIAELGQSLSPDVDLEVVHHHPSLSEPDMGLFDTSGGVLRGADPRAIPAPMLLPGATNGHFLVELGIQSYGFLPMAPPPDFAFA